MSSESPPAYSMNKYLKAPDHIVDLHGYTTAQVEIILSSLFKEGGYSHIRIITGKGSHGDNGPVVRNFVKQYLNNRNIRYNQSKIQDGGEGALEVFVS